MSTPKDIIEGGAAASETPPPEAPATDALQNLTQNVNDAVKSMQDLGDILEEKARQLHSHESVLATREKYGHFKPGAGFTYNPANQSYDIDALSGVEEMAGEVVERFKLEIDAPNLVYRQELDTSEQALAEDIEELRNDPRLSDARPPLEHRHDAGEIDNLPRGVGPDIDAASRSFVSSGTSATSTGFKLLDATDIGTLFGKLDNVENATTGAGNYVTGVTLSVVGKNVKMTQSKANLTYCGYCSYCTYCTYCHCNCDCNCSTN